MTFDHRQWLDSLLVELRTAFGNRLVFFGLQGSFRRGEASPASDLDAVVILDRLDLDDLRAYRAIVDRLPCPEKACGFISGSQELRHWPRHELFQFYHDTEPIVGTLDELIPPLSREEVAAGLAIGVSALYHELGHRFVHGNPAERAEALRGAYKGAFFLLQAKHYLDTGKYVDTRAGLRDALRGAEREIMEISNDWDGCAEWRRANPDRLFELLFSWCDSVLISS